MLSSANVFNFNKAKILSYCETLAYGQYNNTITEAIEVLRSLIWIKSVRKRKWDWFCLRKVYENLNTGRFKGKNYIDLSAFSSSFNSNSLIIYESYCKWNFIPT